MKLYTWKIPKKFIKEHFKFIQITPNKFKYPFNDVHIYGLIIFNYAIWITL